MLRNQPLRPVPKRTGNRDSWSASLEVCDALIVFGCEWKLSEANLKLVQQIVEEIEMIEEDKT